MTRRSLFLVSTIFFAFTLDAALLFGPERPLSPIGYAPPLGTQLPSSIATDGNEFFVVWVDGMFERSGIYGTRVTAAGEIRPESQIVIRRGASSEAAVVWSGNAYLVFWTDSSTIMMAKISREGVLLGAPRVLLERAGVMGGAVVTNGTHVLVPYMTLSPDLHALLIDNDGGILSDEVVARGTDTNRAIKAATDGSSFVLTWTTRYSQHGMQLFASRINAQGKVERDRQLIAGDFIDDADIAYGGGTYAAVVRLTGGVPQHIVAMTVDPQTLVPAEPVLLDAQSHEPAIAYNGSTFVAYWSTLRGLRATTFPTSGSGMPKSVIVNSVVSSSPRFAWNGRNFLAVWMDQTRGDAAYSYGTDVFAQLLDSSGIPAVPAPSLVAFAPATQVMPAIATSGAESYVVWVERTTDKPTGRLLAARVAADGGTEVPLEIAGNATVAIPPRILFRGSSYFVVWGEGEVVQNLFGRRLRRDGTLGSVIAFGAGYSPTLAANATTTLVAFGRVSDLMAVRVTSDDDVLDSPPLLLASHRVNSEFHAATNGSEFLITWTEGSDWWQFPSPGMRDIYGVRVMSNGAVDAAPIAIATGPENQFRGAVSSDGRDFLVAYSMSGEGGIPNVAVKRVLREGATVDGVVVGRGWQPSIVRDGNGYLVTSIVNEGVLLTRLDANGARRDATTIQATGVTAAAAVRAGNSLQLVYARLVDDQQFAAAQWVVIRIGEGARVRSVRH